MQLLGDRMASCAERAMTPVGELILCVGAQVRLPWRHGYHLRVRTILLGAVPAVAPTALDPRMLFIEVVTFRAWLPQGRRESVCMTITGPGGDPGAGDCRKQPQHRAPPETSWSFWVALLCFH